MSDNDVAILLEDIRDQNKAVLEAVGEMQKQLSEVPKRDEFNELAEDVKTIKAAITDTNKQVQNHEKRITKLEATTEAA